jgi:hypothetical protein
MQNVEARQRLLDFVASVDVLEAIRQGTDDAAHGRTRPARKLFDEMRRSHDIPR